MRIRDLSLAIFTLANVGTAAAQDYLAPGPLSAAKLGKSWQLQVQLDPGQTITRAYFADDQIYLGTNDGYVFAIYARTGTLRWIEPITSGGYPVPRPCHVGDRAVFVMPAEVRVFNRQFGEALARRELEFPAGGPAVGDGTRIFFGGLDRRLYALGVKDLFEDWKILTEGQITAAPAIFADYLYFASEDGRVYSCNRENKKFQWRASTFAPITADLIATEEGVYAASRDNSLYLLDILFGQVRWRARLSGPLYEPPVITKGTAYQYCPNDGVVAINTEQILDEDKRIRWRFRDGRTALADDDKFAYVLTESQKLAVLDRESGEVRHSIEAGGFTFGLPDPATQSLIIASQQGHLFCARPIDAPYIRAEDVRAALRSADSQPTSAPAAEAVAEATSQPAQVEEADKPKGPVVGGRSKVSREYGKGGSGTP